MHFFVDHNCLGFVLLYKEHTIIFSPEPMSYDFGHGKKFVLYVILWYNKTFVQEYFVFWWFAIHTKSIFAL